MNDILYRFELGQIINEGWEENPIVVYKVRRIGILTFPIFFFWIKYSILEREELKELPVAIRTKQEG